MAIDQRALKNQTSPESAENAAFANDPESDTPPIKTEGILARARMAPGTDATTVTPEMRKKYGIGAHESVCWKRDEIHVEQWKAVAGNQSLDHWIGQMEGRVVTYQDDFGKTCYVRNGDLLLCAYDSSVDVEFAAIQKANLEKYLEDTSEGDYRGVHRHRDDPDELKALRDYDRAAIADSGMLGQWQGQDWERVIHNLGTEKAQAIMAEHRGTRMTNEDRTEARVNEIAARGAQGSAITSIPANVRARNFVGAKK